MSEHAAENRRPIKTRSSSWAKNLTTFLISRGIKPNQVSLASIGFAGFGAAMFIILSLTDSWWLRMLCFIFCAIAIQGRLICNMLDGMIAVESGMKSKTGEIYNDLPDRVADLFFLLSAGASLSIDRSLIFSGITLGWIASVAAIFTAYIRLLGASIGTSQYFIGPMAKPHRMAILTAACIFSIFETFYGKNYYILALALWIIILGSILTCIRRLRAIIQSLEPKSSLL